MRSGEAHDPPSASRSREGAAPEAEAGARGEKAQLGVSEPAWVGQEDASGCGAATLAMLTGRTYGEARDLIDSLWEKPKDWADGGTNEFDIDRCLYADGFYIQRRYSSWRDNGTAAILSFPDPFAPLHYAMVRQPSHNYHFVVMLADGRVLDPMREGFHALSDWPEVAQVVGLVKP